MPVYLNKQLNSNERLHLLVVTESIFTDSHMPTWPPNYNPDLSHPLDVKREAGRYCNWIFVEIMKKLTEEVTEEFEITDVSPTVSMTFEVHLKSA